MTENNTIFDLTMYNEYWILTFYVQNNNNVFITFPLSHIKKKNNS